MRKGHFFIFLSLLFAGLSITSNAQDASEQHIVEVSGVVLSADGVRPVANAVISVLHQNRGVVSNKSGIFSLVCYPGDTLFFSSVGYRNSTFVLPADYEGKYYNRVQLMVQDTFYLPETAVHALPHGDAFVYAFKYWPVILSPEEIAQARFSEAEIYRLKSTLPMNGAENQSYYQQQQAIQGQYYGQQRNGANLLNPLKWIQFFEAWKRGDFRQKQY